MSTRLSVNINDETADALLDCAQARDVTVTESVRRAVSTYKFFRDAVKDGKEIRLIGPRPQVTRVLLP